MRNWKLDVRGLGLLVRELSPESQGDGTPIVCLHGWLDNGAAFIPMASDRPGRWMALDQRGFGQSDHIGAGGYYHFADLLPDLDALVRTLGGQVDLVGHSMGGTVASMYAAIRPERVRRLVLAEGLGALDWGGASLIDRMRTHLDGIRKPPGPVRLRDAADAAERLMRRHAGLQAEHAALLAEHGITEDERGIRWAFDPLHMVQGAYPFREEWYREFLTAIEAPTMIVWGTQSWYPEEIRQERSAIVQDARVETVPGGHMLPYDAHKALGDLITEHLEL
jgi:pimeloyl-ACP methyl ester carboxylesterase